ncbi:MAG: flavoprotein [Alphaproteobacteria bacterium]|nr:flavoprotein [Alphaproteobacteria bacterium]
MTKNDVETPRYGWTLTGSGHFFKESIALMRELKPLDIFLSAAAEEVLNMYKQALAELPEGTRIFKDRTASAVPVGGFYHGVYHTHIMAPATSNTIAKCVCGISDNLATNVYAQAGKCRVPSIVFACDTKPEDITEAPRQNMVPVFPRRIDLENTEKLKSFEYTTVVESIEELKQALEARRECLTNSCS